MKVTVLVATAIANGDGAFLLGSAELCAMLLELHTSLSWYFNETGFESMHTEFKEAQKAKVKKLEDLQDYCTRTGLHGTVTLENLPEVRRAKHNLLMYQREAVRAGVSKLETLFKHFLRSGTCATKSTLPGLEELRTLSKKDLASTILTLLAMILDQHIAKSLMKKQEQQKRAYVWRKSKPCGLKICTVCGAQGNMIVDHIFSKSCSDKFAMLVQQCLSEWPEVPETSFLQQLYVTMYSDVELKKMMQVKQKARELAGIINS